jgi:hypothetical protein
MEFPKDVTHKPLKTNPIKNPSIPSPEHEPEIRVEEEEEEGGNWQWYQQQTPAQADTDLTGLTGEGLDSQPHQGSPPSPFVNSLTSSLECVRVYLL